MLFSLVCFKGNPSNWTYVFVFFCSRGLMQMNALAFLGFHDFTLQSRHAVHKEFNRVTLIGGLKRDQKDIHNYVCAWGWTSYCVISHDSYHHQGRRVSDRPVVFWLKFWIRRASDERRRALTSTAFVSEEKETSARGRLVGIARAVHRRARLRVSFSSLVCFSFGCCSLVCGKP